MNQQKVKLRGHHLAILAIYYFEDKFGAGVRPGHNSLITKSLYGYGKGMESTLYSVYSLLKTQSELEVEIVEGLDSICQADCPKLSVSCSQVHEGDENQTTLEAYKLRVGETYTARELVRRFVEFGQRTGFRSPRSPFFRKMRF